MTPIQKIAHLLRTPESSVAELFAKMEKLTGKTGVAEKIYQENETVVAQKLQELGIEREKADAPEVEAGILKKVAEADEAFFDFLGKPDFSRQDSCNAMIETLKKTAKVGKGFFVKEEKLRNFLFLNPPKNIMEVLGYQTVNEMMAKEDIYEIFAALRFVENERWLNEVFFRPYHDITPDNFEERETQIKFLNEKWEPIGQKFVGKKLHNISHLKELGLVFLIPTKKAKTPGMALETFSLVLHYLHEIDFYCRLFRKYAAQPDFGNNLVRLVSGEVSALSLSEEGVNWRIIQRYLGKNDPQDPRLFEPHVNPETVHWFKAEKEIDTIGQAQPQTKLAYWRSVDDFAGELFPAGKKGDELVSFDLLDNLISLTHGGIGKYLYHQQEALWNKIFMEFMGEEKLEEMIVENMEKGVIELK
ncbi:MAG TPA: hypothetical protein P5089_01385 [Candidatus Portnoybacteria bacterium]|nr:hypothetical protein [Candidatus Portnoybacteria bacterium]